MSEYRRVTRADKHTKRRNNKRKLLFFTGLAAIFMIILFSLIAFGNNDDNEVRKQEEENTESIAKSDDVKEVPEHTETDTGSTDAGQTDDENNVDDVDEIDSVDDVVIQQIESTDDNVIEAYSGNWEPVGTVQTGPHTTNYDEGSDDRKEIKRAVSVVTGIDENNMTEHWIGNGGEQKVIATVSNKEQTELYHVYLSWVDEKGWQVTKVERIKQIMKKSV